MRIPRGWTADEVEYVRQHVGTKTNREIGEAIGKTKAQVRGLYRYLVPSIEAPGRDVREWTDADLDWIRDHVNTHTWVEIGQHFGVSRFSARMAAEKNGIRRRRNASLRLRDKGGRDGFLRYNFPGEAQEPPPYERLMRQRRDNDRGCWEWTGKSVKEGYGALRVGRQEWRAHRLMWTLHNGTIPTGLFVCHHCDNRRCFNPAHLFLGTAQDNTDDMIRKGRGSWQQRESHAA